MHMKLYVNCIILEGRVTSAHDIKLYLYTLIMIYLGDVSSNYNTMSYLGDVFSRCTLIVSTLIAEAVVSLSAIL